MSIILFEKSFASHPRSANWSNKNTVNPRDVSLNSLKKFWFDCDNCDHEFQADCHNINGGRWCPYCSNRKLCDDDNCKMCFQNSFASHEKSQYWSDQNTLTPRQVFKNSKQQFWFNCNKCNHLFKYLKIPIKNFGLIVMNVIIYFNHRVHMLIKVHGVRNVCIKQKLYYLIN